MVARLLLLALAALAVLLPSHAGAASISYIGAEGDVWLASPDGKTRHRVTDDATATSPYRSPSQMNDGTVVAIRKGGSTALAYFLRRTDGKLLKSWLMPSNGTGLHFAPYSGGQVSPGGGLIAYDYFYAEGPPTYYSQMRVAFLTGPGQTNPCLLNCEYGYIRPRWLPGSDVTGFINYPGFDTVFVQSQSGAQPWFSFANGATKVLSFDSRAGKTVAIADTGAGTFFVMMRNDGGYNTPPTVLCSIGMTGQAVPRLSPDGKLVAWTGDPDGVYVSPAPGGNGPDTVCNMQPKLVGPGGSQPDWGTQNAPDLIPPSASLSAPRQSVGAGRRGGVRLKARCSERCTLRLKGYVNAATAKRLGIGSRRTLVARGSKTGGPGRFGLRAALTARAKAATAGAGALTIRFEGTARDAAGNGRRVAARASLTG